VSKRKKPAPAPAAAPEAEAVAETVAEQAPPPPAPPALEEFARAKGKKKAAKRDVVEEVIAPAKDSEPAIHAAEPSPLVEELDVEMTVNVTGDFMDLPGRDDLDEPTINVESERLEHVDKVIDQRRHLRGALEALVFASDVPIKLKDLAKLVSASPKQVEDMLGELQTEYSTRGLHLEEVGGGWVFRTSAEYAAYVRDLRKERPVRLSRAQVETLAIIAYRQPVTRPEIDDVRGVDSGPVLKLLLERDLVRILGKRDEVGRPIIYGTTPGFLEFFGLNSLKDLPTLKEFTELTEESRAEYEEEIGETVEAKPAPVEEAVAPAVEERPVTMAEEDVPTASDDDLGQDEDDEEEEEEEEQDEDEDEDWDDEDDDDEDDDDEDDDDEDDDEDEEEDEDDE
jgi:segregation and condensation protein B